MEEGEGQQYCLKWNNYQESLSSTFSDLLASDTFVDVTLSCEGQQTVKAHKLLLSACSPYFRRLLSELSPSQHPIILLRDISHSNLVGILEFIYNGEVSIEQDCLPGFLAVAETLRIRGLTGESFIDQRASLETNQGFQSLQSEEGNSEAVEEDKSNNIEAEDPTASSPFPSFFNAGFPALSFAGSRASSEETDSSSVQLEGDGAKKTCPYCFQQLSWHALSRHVRDMHSKVNADMVVCKYCMKTFRNKNSLGCHIWRFHKRGKELITKERGYQVSKPHRPKIQQQTLHLEENESALSSFPLQNSSTEHDMETLTGSL